MEFVYKLNVDNYLMNELVIYNNGGSDEISINYKELTKDIYNYYINRTDLIPPEKSYNDFKEYLPFFKNFKVIKGTMHEKLDYFRENGPGVIRDSTDKPIPSEVKSQNPLYNQTKSPGNCAMILKTAQDLISTDGINIDNNDEVARQMEECAKQTGLYVDITLNSKVNKMPTVNISEPMPTPTDPPKNLLGKYPINSKPFLLDDANSGWKKDEKLKNGQGNIIDSSSPGCIKSIDFKSKQFFGFSEGTIHQQVEKKRKYSIDRCKKICNNNDKCNYIFLHTSKEDMGRCCMMESVDLSGGYKTESGQFLNLNLSDP